MVYNARLNWLGKPAEKAFTIYVSTFYLSMFRIEVVVFVFPFTHDIYEVIK